MMSLDEIRRDVNNPAKVSAYPNSTRVGKHILDTVSNLKQPPSQDLIDAVCRLYEGAGEVEHGGCVSPADYGATFRRGITLDQYIQCEDENFLELIDREAIEGWTNVVIDMITTMLFEA